MRSQRFSSNFGQPVYWSSGLRSVLLENLHVTSCSGTLELVGPWVVLGFSVSMEVFDELLSINVPWIQEFSDVLRIWT